MKLIRFGNPGLERPGVLLNDATIADVSGTIRDFDEQFLGSDGLEQLEKLIREKNYKEVNAGGLRLGPPIARPSKIICVGLNYSRHAAESGMTLPTEPVIFFKSTTALCGPNDPIIIPKDSEKTDWEVELAVVIGRKATYVSEAAAMDHVAGYVLHNDVSERAFQLERGGQWVKGKSADSFAPMGPWLLTSDEVADSHNLRLWLKLNGKMMQDDNTSDLVFNVPHLISYISRFMTLLPGDVISTGTPAGVGLGLKPPTYLKPGDVIELGIEGLGSATQHVISWEESQR
ncbi:MAG: fumarylacetoacetate hydrolase family protein [Bacteroidota bacterium]